MPPDHRFFQKVQSYSPRRVGPPRAMNFDLRALVARTAAGKVRSPRLSALGRGAVRLRLRPESAAQTWFGVGGGEPVLGLEGGRRHSPPPVADDSPDGGVRRGDDPRA